MKNAPLEFGLAAKVGIYLIPRIFIDKLDYWEECISKARFRPGRALYLNVAFILHSVFLLQLSKGRNYRAILPFSAILCFEVEDI